MGIENETITKTAYVMMCAVPNNSVSESEWYGYWNLEKLAYGKLEDANIYVDRDEFSRDDWDVVVPVQITVEVKYGD